MFRVNRPVLPPELPENLPETREKIMPRKYEMSWEGAPNYRWCKMHKGTRYRVSCDDLKAAPTKEGSYQAANNWWLRKVAELTVRQVEPEQQQLLDAIQRKLDYSTQHHHPEVVEQLTAAAREIMDQPPGEIVLPDSDQIEFNLTMARQLGIVVPPDLDPVFLQQFFGDRPVWQDRLKDFQATAANKTVGHQLEQFLRELRTQQKPKTHIEVSAYLRGTLGTEVWAAATNVETIDEQTVSRHYAWLVAQNLASVSHNKYLGFFRRFIRWLYTSGLIPREPLNNQERSHRKKKTHKPVKRYENIKTVVESLPHSLPHPFRLWALLGLNCGMTQDDWGETAWDSDIDGFPQIDTATWVLTRRRVKTGDQPQTPTVRYQLWPETIVELKRLPSRTGLLFTTRDGKPMYETFYRCKNCKVRWKRGASCPQCGGDGKAGKKDLFSDYWQEPTITPGKFRSVATTALKSDKLFRGFEEYFLAHSPKTIADQHYGAEDDTVFFEALQFIRRKLGWGDE